MNHSPYQTDQQPGHLSRAGAAPTPAAHSECIGERVRAARIAAHLTQQELAGTRYSKSYISAVERGKMTPSLQALHILAERLGVSLSFLLGEEAHLAALERPARPEAPAARAEEDQQTLLLSEAERLLNEEHYEAALARFEQAGQPERTHQAREQYAQFLAAQGRYQEAYEQMRHAIQRSR